MPIVPPRADVDANMPSAAPVASIDFKIVVKDPRIDSSK